VFCNEFGRRGSAPTQSKRFVQLRKRAGVPVGSLHVLRHTHATAGVSFIDKPLTDPAETPWLRAFRLVGTYQSDVPTRDEP
jgi:hypothetical protein